MKRLRWRLWGLITGLPGVCPANAHSVLIWQNWRSVRIDSMCRRGCAETGSCWCGKLRAERDEVAR